MFTPALADGLSVRTISVTEYHRLIADGFFGHDERIELVDGLLIAMSPSNPPHASTVTRLTHLLVRQIGAQALVRVQQPITLADEASEPEPDIAIVATRPDAYETEHPTGADVLWLIEVSDSTLALDRSVKANLYARAGITEYWIVNLPEQEIEIRRDPAGQGESARYLSHTLLTGDAFGSPLALPDAEIPLSLIFKRTEN